MRPEEPADRFEPDIIRGEAARVSMKIRVSRSRNFAMRSSTGDILVPLIPHKQLSLEQALEFCRADECVEVTPHTVRLRKVILDANERVKASRRTEKASR
mgnify:CR=1 FL=1